MKIRIIGSGSWACGLSKVLVDNNHDVLMIGIDPNEVNDINLNHRNSKYFNDSLNPNIKASLDYNDIADADVILLAIPSKVLKSVANKIINIISKPVYIINVSKGFDPETHKRLSVVIKDLFNTKAKAIVSLIGPSHAEEVIKGLLTVVNAVSDDLNAAKLIQELFSNNYFRVYVHSDVIGAEIGSALKNIMAIASGILEGLNQGDNARAALMTRGLYEMTRFGLALGANKETFLGLNGVGDLIVTCTSYHSRNFNAGLAIGKNDGAKEFLENNKTTVEGIIATKLVYDLANEMKIELPIVNEVYEILYNFKKPSLSIILDIISILNPPIN